MCILVWSMTSMATLRGILWRARGARCDAAGVGPLSQPAAGRAGDRCRGRLADPLLIAAFFPVVARGCCLRSRRRRDD